MIVVKIGIDVLAEKRERQLKGLHLGLIVNGSSVNSFLKPTIFILQEKGYRITSLFAPEHGLWGAQQDQVKEVHGFDPATGLKFFSLYGRVKKPTPAMLARIDGLVFDIQDVGARYYTFIWTMALAMEACCEEKKVFIVLDRPNPINGIDLEGPMLDSRYRSFVGLYPIPIRHGMTAGEIALFIKENYLTRLELTVVKMSGWRRRMWYEETKLPWVMPSPNMPSVDTAVVYPGICLLEGTNISEGRGTTRPFEIFGAPWIDPYHLKAALEKEDLPGVIFRPLYFKPTFHKYKNRICGGLQIYVINRSQFKPVLTGLAILRTVRKLYPESFAWREPPYEDEKEKLPFDILVGNSSLRKSIEQSQSLAVIEGECRRGLKEFLKLRRKVLLYG